MDIFWFIPLHGDGRYLGSQQGARAVDHAYMKQVAQAADALGYGGVLLPTGRSCEDSWISAASLIPVTERLKFLVALRPTTISPTVAARQAATLDRLSGGRLLVNVVAGGDSADLEADGTFLSHDERYEHAREFLHVWTRLLKGEEVTYEGKYIRVKGARQFFPAVQKPHPPLYFGGSSDAAHDLAAEQVELYLTWGEPPAEVEKKFKDVRRRAEKLGRKVKFGVRLHVIARETNEEAWAAADRLISHLDDATIAKAQANIATMDSEGQKRMAALHGGNRAKLEISPNLWAGVGLVRGGAARPWWVTAKRLPAASRSTRTSVPRPLCCRVTRTSKRPTASPSWCFRMSASRPRVRSRWRLWARSWAMRWCRPWPKCRKAEVRMSTLHNTRDAEIDKGDLFLDSEPPASTAILNPHPLWAMSIADSPFDWRPLLKGVEAVASRLLPWLVPLVLIVFWQLSSAFGWLSTRVLPAPLSVLEAAWALAHGLACLHLDGKMSTATAGEAADRVRAAFAAILAVQG